MQIVKLDGPTWAAARARLALVEQHEVTARLLRHELECFVSQATGVNLTCEQWNLDIEHGLLEKECVTDGE